MYLKDPEGMNIPLKIHIDILSAISNSQEALTTRLELPL